MAKVFTITDGVENLGALKSGGQGSVYKARRNGEAVTAIKILPTPISSESDDDKNFASFQNEVQKLKRVNEYPNPNVVSIIDSGITNTGNLPYIEMEYIEGPDLGELLKPPYDPVFTIKKIIKVADHLANALAHCHLADVKHGDIKSNNVKFNQRTSNYILLDFGLSIMSDEQRRTSIRHAGAIEFMAPEQNSGVMLFETDIYSFGIILFELITGTVPFPLHSKGEIARNAVMLAHMESQPPDILTLRSKALPDWWGIDKKEKEMQVPAWLITMIYRCLEKDPARRYKNGCELQEFIHAAILAEENVNIIEASPRQTAILQVNGSKWEDEIQKLELKVAEKDELINDLRFQVEAKDKELYQYQYNEQYIQAKPRGISKGLFFTLLIITFGLAGYTAYNSFILPYKEIPTENTLMRVNQKLNNAFDSIPLRNSKPAKKVKGKAKKTATMPVSNRTMTAAKSLYEDDEAGSNEAADVYKVINTAYFHNMPDENSKRNAYVVNDELLTALNEKDDFIYVEFINDEGKVTKGWLSKKDLIAVN